MTHTPGPWGIVSRFVGPLYIVAEVSTDIDKSGQMEIAHVGAETFSTAQANAQLISAAPEMLEALREIVLQYVVYTDDDLKRISMRVKSEDDGVPMSRHWAEKLIAARAAIAKARGTT